jgi:Uma2 family endonuclease
MTVSAEPVRLDFDDYVRYTEMHPDGDFELIHGVIYKLAPEGEPHLLTRHGIHDFLMQTLDLKRYTPWNEASIPSPGWTEGPKPDNSIARDASMANMPHARNPTISY